MKWLKQYSRTLSWSIPGRHQALSLSGCFEVITAEMCLCWKKQTVTYCRLSLSLSPSSLVSLFLPWGGDGRFLQGKSNDLSCR